MFGVGEYVIEILILTIIGNMRIVIAMLQKY